MNIKSKSQQVADDINALLRAKNPLLWIVTREEERVERYLFTAAAAANLECRTWDVAQGVANIEGQAISNAGSPDPGETLAYIKTCSQIVRQKGDADGRYLWIMRDLPVWFQGPGGAPVVRSMRNLARLLPGVPPKSAQSIVVLSPSGEIPPELANHTTVIEWPLPDRQEIGDLLDEIVASYEGKIEPLNGNREAVIDAAVGLSEEEAQACISKSIVQLKKVDALAVANEKKRVIAREKLLEWYDPLPGGMDAVGGLENIKAYLQLHSCAYSPEARAYGLPLPNGIFLVGVQGCGKTMVAQAAATFFGCPLLRFDPNALKSKFVGESETKTRQAYKVIDAIGRCVVWIDEIEKALQGATSGSSDGGVSADALGSLLTWMQEKQARGGQSFVIATANDVESLPPELLRKGRFDELFFVDLPNKAERVSVLDATLRKHKQTLTNSEILKVAAACEKDGSGFTGSEIASLVPEAMFNAFADWPDKKSGERRKINVDDLLTVAANVVPLAETAKEKIDKLRNWAKGRARPASISIAEVVTGSKRRVVDLR